MKGMVKLFINFKKLLAHQPEVKLQETKNTVGSIVRWERKRRNMTLHEGAEGICSVSYLSKVENSLIEPSEQILDNLKKRLEIETLIDFDLQRYDEHYDDIIQTIFNYKQVSSFYYDMYFGKKDYKSKLVLYSFYISNDALEKARPLYKDLEIEISKLTHKEINLFFYMTSLLFYKEGRYYLSHEVLKLTKIITNELSLKILIDHLRYLLQVLIGRNEEAFKTFKKLKEVLITNQNYKRYQDLSNQRVVLNLSHVSYDVGVSKINKLKERSKIEKLKYLSFLQYINDRNINISKGESHKKENPELYMILLLHYDRLNDFNKIQELIKEDKKFKLNFIVEQLEFFLVSKYTSDQESFSRYIIQITKDIKSNYNGINVINKLFDVAASYFENQNYYKTANSIRKQLFLLQEDLKKSSEF